MRRRDEARVCEPSFEVEPQHEKTHQDDSNGGRGGDKRPDVNQPSMVHAEHPPQVEAWG